MLNLASIFLFVIIGIVLWLWTWENSSFVRHFEQLPGPPKKLIVGNIFSVPSESREFFKTTQKKWVQQYGRIFRFWRMMNPNIVVSAPEFVEPILAGQKHIEKSQEYQFVSPWLGDGLLISNGPKWKKDRRMLTPSFHFRMLDNFFDDFNRNAAILNRVIESKMLVNEEMDVCPLLSACTLDIICEAAMGVQVNAQLGDCPYTEALERLIPLFRERYTSLWGIAPNWLYKLSPKGRQFQNSLDTVHAFTVKALRDRRADRENNNHQIMTTKDDEFTGIKERKAFLDMMLDIAEETGELSEQNILNQVDTFMFAGHDTTSTALTWVLYSLASNPLIQDQVYEELVDVFDGSDRPCTLEDLSHLTYLDCCVKESIRLHPSVPLIRRKVSENVQLGKYTVPAGTTVAIQIYALHHNEEHFPNPESFKPERFLPEESAGRHPYAFIPFSAGSRNCIGQKYAVYEEKVILASLLRKFRFNIDPQRKIEETSDGVLKPFGGMHLIITKR